MAQQTIFDIFQMVKGGYALNQANKELPELIRAIKESGKKGTIVLKLHIIPDKQDEHLVEFEPDYDMKKPRRAFAKGHGYIDRNYKLTKEDPAQLELLEQRRQELAEAGVEELRASEARLEQVGRGGS